MTRMEAERIVSECHGVKDGWYYYASGSYGEWYVRHVKGPRNEVYSE